MELRKQHRSRTSNHQRQNIHSLFPGCSVQRAVIRECLLLRVKKEAHQSSSFPHHLLRRFFFPHRVTMSSAAATAETRTLVFSTFSPFFPPLINIVIFTPHLLPIAISLLIYPSPNLSLSSSTYFEVTFTYIFKPFPLRFDQPNPPLSTLALIHSHQSRTKTISRNHNIRPANLSFLFIFKTYHVTSLSHSVLLIICASLILIFIFPSFGRISFSISLFLIFCLHLIYSKFMTISQVSSPSKFKSSQSSLWPIPNSLMKSSNNDNWLCSEVFAQCDPHASIQLVKPIIPNMPSCSQYSTQPVSFSHLNQFHPQALVSGHHALKFLPLLPFLPLMLSLPYMPLLPWLPTIPRCMCPNEVILKTWFFLQHPSSSKEMSSSLANIISNLISLGLDKFSRGPYKKPKRRKSSTFLIKKMLFFSFIVPSFFSLPLFGLIHHIRTFPYKLMSNQWCAILFIFFNCLKGMNTSFYLWCLLFFLSNLSSLIKIKEILSELKFISQLFLSNYSLFISFIKKIKKTGSLPSLSVPPCASLVTLKCLCLLIICLIRKPEFINPNTQQVSICGLFSLLNTKYQINLSRMQSVG
ncbi:hypothetical protein VP01_1064g2 [Puccinia sorghi]|uniref:Uncharacterized protein n=1 Tax=Puccinia sorghi TaxID=27349 RepID=A0A0L6VV69_9BASI|nr:hypothetical protein VP01_1064g2 [Puccinia sorghi]